MVRKTINLKVVTGLVIICVLSGCTVPVYFEKSLPPEISTGAQNPTAAFINRYDYTMPGTVREKYRDCYRLGTIEITKDIRDLFGQSDLMKVTEADTLLPGMASPFLGAPLLSDSVIQMCRKYNTPFLIVLESMNFWLRGEKTEEDEEDPKLISLKQQNVYLELKAGFSFYGSSGNLLHRDSIAYMTLYKTRLSFTSEIWLFEPSLKKSGPAIISLAKSISEAYYNKLLPGKETIQKMLFAGKGLGKARRFIMSKDWDGAIEILLPLAGSSNPEMAEQAAYNLSVMYEIKGDMGQSNFWLNKSGGKKPQEVVKFN